MCFFNIGSFTLFVWIFISPKFAGPIMSSNFDHYVKSVFKTQKFCIFDFEESVFTELKLIFKSFFGHLL